METLGWSTIVLNCAAAAIMMLQALAAPGMERKASEFGLKHGSLRDGKGISFCSHSLVRMAVLLVMRLDSWMIVEAMVKKDAGESRDKGHIYQVEQ